MFRTREACRVDEEPSATAEDVELCIMESRSRRRRYELVRRWNDAAARVGGPLVDPAAPYPEFQLAERVDRIEGAFGWEEGGWDNLRDRLRAAGTRIPPVPASGDLAMLAETLRVAALHVREKALAGWLNSVGTFLTDGKAQPGASCLWTELLDAFTGRAWDRWGQIADEVRRVYGLVADVARFDDLGRRLAQTAPVWARQIFDSEGSGNDAETALRAWEWRQADTWLRAVMSADDPAVLQRQLEEKLRQESRLTADLAAESAWLGLADRLTDRERMALTAWVGALRKVGKGTGKYAAHWRAEAQKAMRDAQGAVPVWIMPAHRVVESFDATTARFDVVIVDESSQCDLFGLAALSLADKAVIVGDDKQISPSAIGTEESAVHELIRHYIPDVPQSGLLDIKSSLYDMAKMRFPGVIMLREHFRCLPEIIEFSNGLCYGGKIMPLREQPADPSWQSVVDVFLEDGFREKGTDTNEAEASFIVDKIASLCADPAYDGKTFGVISLIGDAQAGLIEGQLVARLGEKEMERRQIRCGNAYHFQGDERDVMFLSLVAAAGEGRRIGALTKEADRQRVNVAASRARDQMWCVRSVQLEELHPDDVRSVLIRHCQNPGAAAAAAASDEVRFDSDFERSVFQQIVARGYQVSTQYRVGRYRIDQVIEGAGAGRRRLALELDGDAYHGPDRFEADRNRQAILERLGWTFHRIRGSAYYRDPDEALGSLWERLEALEIRPAGEEPAVPPQPAEVERMMTAPVTIAAVTADAEAAADPAAWAEPSLGEVDDLNLADVDSVDLDDLDADDFDANIADDVEFTNDLPTTRTGEPGDRTPAVGRDPSLDPHLTPGLPITDYTGQQLTRLTRWIRSDGVARSDDELLTEMMEAIGRLRLRAPMRKRLIAAIGRTTPKNSPGPEPQTVRFPSSGEELPGPADIGLTPGSIEGPVLDGNGMFVVGTDISHGTYVVPGPEKNGAGFTLLASPDICDVIKYYPVRGQLTVTIGPGVKAVRVRDCLPWRRSEEGREPAIMDDATLHRRFEQHVLADINYLKRRGYNPTRFLGIIRQRGSAVSAAKYLFANPRHTSYGFERLWEMGELERSMEFAANLPWFTSLFTADELDEARSRLILHEFPFEERLARAAAHCPEWVGEG
ncbi:MAG TPA: AAA domain-containing protein [Trebonia sp.]